MPSRSTPESITSRRLYQVLVCLLGVSMAAGLSAAEVIPYEVTSVDQFSAGRVHGRDAYEGKGRGDPDWEPMPEVRFADHRRLPPPVQVVHPSAPPPVTQVVVRPEPQIVLVGEDKVFDQVRLDLDIQRCIFQNICTDEVKAIPGVYLGEEQLGDEDWSGRADDALQVISEDRRADDSPPTEPGSRAPGRVFVEEPAQASP